MVIDNINIKDITDKILKKFQSENSEEVKKIADQAQLARNTLRTFNKQPLNTYRQMYVPLFSYTNIIPWGTKEVDDQVKTAFTYAYSRANNQSIGSETSTVIDVLSCLYNCMVVQIDDAASEQDLLQRVRELIKAQFYIEEALKYLQDNKSLLYNISELYGEQFFLICKHLIEAQRYECQAILRSQKNDVIADVGSFEQFIGIMTAAKEAYSRVQKLSAGMQKSAGMQQLIDFAKNRYNSVMCVIQYVSGAHLATANPGQAIKDLLTALDYKSDHVDTGTINQLMMPLWSIQGIHPAPQVSQYKPMTIDVSTQYQKYDLDFNVPDQNIILLPQKMIPIYTKIKQGIITKLQDDEQNSENNASLNELETLITNLETMLSENKIGNIIFKCQELNQQSNLRERLIKGTEYDVLLKEQLDQVNKLQNALGQIAMADQDNIRKYGSLRWKSEDAMQQVNQTLQEVNYLAGALSNSQNCVDYLKQYQNNDYDKLFEFSKNCTNTTMDDSIVKSINENISTAKKKISSINNNTDYEQLIKINEIYAILKDYEFDQKKLDPTINYVLNNLKTKGIIVQKNQDFTVDIENLKSEQERYLKQFNLQLSDASDFETKIQIINNLLVTLQSGEQFMESMKEKLSSLKSKIKGMTLKYRQSVESQWDDFSAGKKMMEITVE